MIVRYFEPQDFEEVLEIESEAFAEHNPFIYMGFYEMHNDCFLVAAHDGYVVGFVAGYQVSENEGRIFSLAVRSGYRSYGIGTLLLGAVNSIFNEKALRYASLEVRISNKGAQKLYRKMDFIPCWIEHGYYSDGEDGVIMKKALSPYNKTPLNKIMSKSSCHTRWPALKIKNHI